MRAIVLLLVLVSSVALAEEPPPDTCFANRARWAYDRGNETLAAPGERFLEDMNGCAPTFAAAVIEAVRFQIQSDEAKKFVRAKNFVMAAYGVAWAVLAVSALFIFLRQRRLAAEIALLEAKVREAEKP